MRHYFVDVESSIYDSMVWGIRPSACKLITPVPITAIDKSRHRVDVNCIMRAYNGSITRAKLIDFDCLPASFGLDKLSTKREKVETMLKWGYQNKAYACYTLMSDTANAPLFGDVDTKIKNLQVLERKRLKFNNYTEIKFDRTNKEEAVKLINDYLNKGIVRITFIGGRQDVFATNNKDIIASIHGSDYIVRYGSLTERIKLLEAYLNSCGTNDKSIIGMKIIDFNLYKEYCNDGFLDLSIEDKLKTLAARREEIRASMATKANGGVISYVVADNYSVIDVTGSISIYRITTLDKIAAIAFYNQKS
jgi:hypothetical protein